MKYECPQDGEYFSTPTGRFQTKGDGKFFGYETGPDGVEAFSYMDGGRWTAWLSPFAIRVSSVPCLALKIAHEGLHGAISRHHAQYPVIPINRDSEEEWIDEQVPICFKDCGEFHVNTIIDSFVNEFENTRDDVRHRP